MERQHLPINTLETNENFTYPSQQRDRQLNILGKTIPNKI